MLCANELYTNYQTLRGLTVLLKPKRSFRMVALQILYENKSLISDF